MGNADVNHCPHCDVHHAGSRACARTRIGCPGCAPWDRPAGTSPLDVELADIRAQIAENPEAVAAALRGLAERITPGQGAAVLGHELAALQIAKHGTDRYPSPEAQFGKVHTEMHELEDAIMDHVGGTCEQAGYHQLSACPHVRAGYAGVGLSLYSLGNKLEIDLVNAMATLVAADGRRFAAPDPA